MNDECKWIFDQLNYDIFLAEQSFNMAMDYLDNKAKVVTESAEIIVLNESVADVIRKFIYQVTDSIQRAWNNFKAIINYGVIHFVIDKNEKYLQPGNTTKMKLPVNFEYPNFKEWDQINKKCKVGNNLLDHTNYNQMSEYLESKEKFLSQYYKDYVEEENGKQLSFKDVFEKKCFAKASDNEVVDINLVIDYKKFLLKYNEQVKEIQDDIDNVNKVNHNIDQLLKQVVGESVYIGNLILTEGEGDNNPSQSTTTNNPSEDKTKFRNADPNAQQKPNNSKDRQNIVNYYKAMTSILSAKMRTCNKVKTNSLRIVTKYIRIQGGTTKAPENKKEDNNQGK